MGCALGAAEESVDMAKSSSAKVNVRRIGVRSGSEFFRNDADHIWTVRVEALSPNARWGESWPRSRTVACGLIKDSRRRSGSCGKAGEGSDQRVQIWNADRTHLVTTILTIQLLSSNAIQLPTPNGSVQIDTRSAIAISRRHRFFRIQWALRSQLQSILPVRFPAT